MSMRRTICLLALPAAVCLALVYSGISVGQGVAVDAPQAAATSGPVDGAALPGQTQPSPSPAPAATPNSFNAQPVPVQQDAPVASQRSPGSNVPAGTPAAETTPSSGTALPTLDPMVQSTSPTLQVIGDVRPSTVPTPMKARASSGRRVVATAMADPFGRLGPAVDVYGDPRVTAALDYSFANGARYAAFAAMQGGEDDPEIRTLIESDQQFERQAMALAQQYRGASDDSQREALRAQIEDVTKKHFAVRQQRREKEIARLEAQLQRLSDLIKKRNDAQELIIKRRVTNLLGEEDELAF